MSYGLNRQFGVIPDGFNAFTVHLHRPAAKEATAEDLKREKAIKAAKRQNEQRRGMTLAKRAALTMRTPAERKADRAAELLAFKEQSAFNAPITPPTPRGTSANARARASI